MNQMFKISKVTIKNFRSIDSIHLDADQLTTFVGKNDSGKSNILRALNLFFNGKTDYNKIFSFQEDFNIYSITPEKKAKEITIEITLDLPESYIKPEHPNQVTWKKVWRKNGIHETLCNKKYIDGTDFPTRSKIPALLEKISYYYIPATKDLLFFRDLQGQVYEVLSQPSDNILNNSTSAFENQIQNQIKELTSSINSTLSSTNTLKLPTNLRSIFENLEFNSESIPFSRRGDGIKVRHIPDILNFIGSKKSSSGRGSIQTLNIWGFEEPENNIEMSACFELTNQITNYINSGYQCFLTTHSPIFYGINTDSIGISLYNIFKDEKITKSKEIIEKNQLDEHMGFITLIHPYIQNEKNKFDRINQELEKIKGEGLQSEKPTILVEGETDKLIVEKILSLKSSGAQEKYIILNKSKDSYGSAEHVAHRLIAQHMLNKTRSKKIKIAAILDHDEAGTKAFDKFKTHTNNEHKHEKIFLLKRKNKCPALDHHIILIQDLEYFYSDSIWEKANHEKWLEPRDNPAELIRSHKLNELLRQGTAIKNAFPNNILIRLLNKFSDTGKLQAAKYIRDLDNTEALTALNDLLPILDPIIDFLNSDKDN